MVFSKLRQLIVFGCAVVIATSAVDAQESRTDTAADAVAIVNGAEIPYKLYERARLTHVLNRGGSPKDTSSISQVEDDGIFLSLVDAELAVQKAEEMGLGTSRDEAIERLISDPPPSIREIFADRYQPKVLRNLILNPKSISNYISDPNASSEEVVAEWTTDIDNLLRYYTIQAAREKLVDSLFRKDTLTDADVRYRYHAEKTVIKGSVIRVLHSTLPESCCPVTDVEARRWYNDHLDEYAIPESQKPLSILIPVVPSPEDSARHHERVETARNEILSAPIQDREKIVNELSADLPPNRVAEGHYVSPADFSSKVTQDLAIAREGDVIGPYPVEKESLLLYVNDSKRSKDTLVRARHILIKIPNDTAADPEEIRAFVEELRDSIDSEDEFIQAVNAFSEDAQSRSRDGDMGYVPRGRYVPTFDSVLFRAPMNQVVGPFETRFGYHLIWVSDKMAQDFALRELRFPLEPSQTVRDAVRSDAEKYSTRLRQGEPQGTVVVDATSKYGGVVVDSLTFVKRLEPYADALVVTEALFRADVGDAFWLDVPSDRVGVFKLIDFWPGGAPDYSEGFKPWPVGHARRKKQLDSLEKSIDDLDDKITPETMLGPIREHAPMAEVFVLQEQVIQQMEDEDPRLLDSLVAVTKEGEVEGPVRGKHALYFLRINDKYAPTRSEFDREFPDFRTRYLAKYKEGLLEDLMKEARANADVVDNRPSTVRILSRLNL